MNRSQVSCMACSVNRLLV